LKKERGQLLADLSTSPLPLLGFLRQAQDKLLALRNGRKQKDLTPMESGLLI
jgi:hypothetical protein